MRARANARVLSVFSLPRAHTAHINELVVPRVCEDDETWYQAEVASLLSSGATLVRYIDDGVEEALDLRYELWRPVGAPTPEDVARARARAGPAPANAARTGYSRSNSQSGTPEPLDRLHAYVEQLGGSSALVEGWSCLRFKRGVAGGASKLSSGQSYYLTYYDARGKQYRSMIEVARALGLAGAGNKVAPAGNTRAMIDNVERSSNASTAAGAAYCVETSADESLATRDPAADQEVSGAKRQRIQCWQASEVAGGFFGCILPYGHEGAHCLDASARRAQKHGQN